MVKVCLSCDFRGFSGVLDKVGIYRWQITASWPLKCRFVALISHPCFRSCRGSSESRYKGKKFSLRSTNVSPTFFRFLRFFRLARQPSGHLVIWSFVKIEKRCCQNRHYNINILFIYSEQWPRSRNRKWPNDLDQMTTWFFMYYPRKSWMVFTLTLP